MTARRPWGKRSRTRGRLILLAVLALAACIHPSSSRTDSPQLRTDEEREPDTIQEVPTDRVGELSADEWRPPETVVSYRELIPGAPWQEAVDSAPPGTVFVVKAGVHLGQTVVPKDGNWFLGQPEAIMDGAGAEVAFAGIAADVRIEGLIIQDYASPAQIGAIHGSGDSWVVARNEVRYNASVGIVVGPKSQVIGNHVHHNGQVGLKASGADIVVSGNEVAFNNFLLRFDPNWEAGGAKFLFTRRLVVEDNHIHDNGGAGLWTDTDNFETRIENNRIVDNAGPGVLHEASFSALIAGNHIEGNGHGWYVGGVLIANSTGVEVARNVLIDNNGGVSAVNQERGPEHKTKDLWVHSNRISYDVGWTGFFAEADAEVAFTGWNVRFEDNRYKVTGSRPYLWAGQELDAEGWRAFGHDIKGLWTAARLTRG